MQDALLAAFQRDGCIKVSAKEVRESLNHDLTRGTFVDRKSSIGMGVTVDMTDTDDKEGHIEWVVHAIEMCNDPFEPPWAAILGHETTVAEKVRAYKREYMEVSASRANAELRHPCAHTQPWEEGKEWITGYCKLKRSWPVQQMRATLDCAKKMTTVVPRFTQDIAKGKEVKCSYGPSWLAYKFALFQNDYEERRYLMCLTTSS